MASTSLVASSTICSCESRCSRISRIRTHASFARLSEKFLESIQSLIRTSGCWREPSREVARHRLDTVKWEDFSRPEVSDPMDSARRSIAQHRVAAMQKTQTTEAQAVPADLLAAQCFTLSTSIHSAVVNAIKTEALPRYSLQKIREPNPYLLRVLFEPSARDGLEHDFGDRPRGCSG